ncbi:MAG: hypothetical protein NZ455_07345 [Bacteroidia bacterium]|nr:hypothetical protein [Bacteroidia bacterium]
MSAKIRKTIQMIAGTHIKAVKTFTATVLQVHEDYTITAQSGSDVPVIARLKAVLEVENSEGFILIPAQNSQVIITEVDLNQYAVIGYSAVDKIVLKTENIQIQMDKNGIVFNEGSFGGLIKIQELRNKLDKINQILQAIMSVFQGVPIAEPGNGSPSALQATLAAALAGKLLPTYANIENDKVKH